MALVSCAPLPEYARPQMHTPIDANLNTESGFSYRILTRADFQAGQLPENRRQYTSSINALSCLSIRPTRNTRVQISRTHYHGYPVYVGSFAEIAFETVFIPSCSWLNKSVKNKKEPYVLQHEQAHFAIAELTARKINRQLNLDITNFTALGSTEQEVQTDLQEMLRVAARELIESDLKIHEGFDEDTSMFHDPETQETWLKDLEKRLASGH